MGLKSMNAGDGQTSYANNSGLQKIVISKTWPVLDETLKDMFMTGEKGFPKRMRMADLGCASGPNTLLLVSHIIDTIQDLYHKHDDVVSRSLPEIEVFLNDLPDNDFNNLFKLMPAFFNNINGKEKKSECFLYAAPGSFYNRLFPTRSLHFVYSSYSLHWLSQIPEGLGNSNKENIFIAMKSPPEVVEAYAKQFRRDFFKFLRMRGEELTAGGRMVLTFIAREFAHFTSNDGIIQFFTSLAEILLHMVAQGIVKEQDLYSFNMPIYAPCLEEVEAIIHGEGSFNLVKMEVIRVPWDANEQYDDDRVRVFDKHRSGKLVADGIRALVEPLLVSQFGACIDLDHVFGIYTNKMADYLSIERASYFSPIVSLTRK